MSLPASVFQTYQLSEQDTITAAILSPLQKLHIQNMIASYAVDRVNRQIDVNNITATVQKDAETLGSIKTLLYLLDLSAIAENPSGN